MVTEPEVGDKKLPESENVCGVELEPTVTPANAREVGEATTDGVGAVYVSEISSIAGLPAVPNWSALVNVKHNLNEVPAYGVRFNKAPDVLKAPAAVALFTTTNELYTFEFSYNLAITPGGTADVLPV
jgi:hypothetical protein